MSAIMWAIADKSSVGFQAKAKISGIRYAQAMLLDGWRTRLQQEIERVGSNRSRASEAAEMNRGWLSEIINDGKEPTLEAFVQMCVTLGMRLNYILFNLADDRGETEFQALFDQLDPPDQASVRVLMNSMRSSRASKPGTQPAPARPRRGRPLKALK